VSTQKNKHHPQQLFSINNEGIPWEEASGAKNSRDLLTKWKRHYRHLNNVWILMWGSFASVFLIMGLYFVAVNAGFQFGAVAKIIIGILFCVSVTLAYLLGFFVVLFHINGVRKYYVALIADGEGYWDSVDPDLGYMNLSVPTIIQDEGEMFLCVAPQFLWASTREDRETYYHPNCYGDFNYFYKMPLPHEVKFYNSERQDEFMRSKHDTHVRLLVAKILYAKQQISWLERLALEKSSDLVVDEQGELVSVLLDDYKACKNWYDQYLNENLAMFNEIIEKQLVDRVNKEKQKNLRENIVRETLSITG
jgi:hypothetical protein